MKDCQSQLHDCQCRAADGGFHQIALDVRGHDTLARVHLFVTVFSTSINVKFELADHVGACDNVAVVTALGVTEGGHVTVVLNIPTTTSNRFLGFVPGDGIFLGQRQHLLCQLFFKRVDPLVALVFDIIEAVEICHFVAVNTAHDGHRQQEEKAKMHKNT